MKIEVLGTGCKKCLKLFQLVEEVVADCAVDATVQKVEKLEEIMKRGVLFTPALVIDGQVKAAGTIPKAQQIASWIRQSREQSGRQG